MASDTRSSRFAVCRILEAARQRHRRALLARASSRALSRPRIRLLRLRYGFVALARFTALCSSRPASVCGSMDATFTSLSPSMGDSPPSISIGTSPESVVSTTVSKKISVAVSRSTKSYPPTVVQGVVPVLFLTHGNNLIHVTFCQRNNVQRYVASGKLFVVIELKIDRRDVVEELLRIDGDAVFVVSVDDVPDSLFELDRPPSDLFHDVPGKVILKPACCFIVDAAQQLDCHKRIWMRDSNDLSKAAVEPSQTLFVRLADAC